MNHSLNSMSKMSRVLLETLNSMMLLAKAESGKLEISTSEFSLKSIFEEVLDILSYLTIEYNCDVSCNFDTNLRFLVSTDKVKLRQVII